MNRSLRFFLPTVPLDILMRIIQPLRRNPTYFLKVFPTLPELIKFKYQLTCIHIFLNPNVFKWLNDIWNRNSNHLTKEGLPNPDQNKIQIINRLYNSGYMMSWEYIFCPSNMRDCCQYKTLLLHITMVIIGCLYTLAWHTDASERPHLVQTCALILAGVRHAFVDVGLTPRPGVSKNAITLKASRCINTGSSMFTWRHWT